MLLNTTGEDSVQWTLHPSGSFTTKTAWEAIRVKVPIVPWHKVIWCSHYVPRWAIIEWIALLGRLPTKDKLHAWGVISDDGCDLCGLGQETHGHLFFSCAFSARVWAHFLQVNDTSRAGHSFPDEVAWMGQHSRSSKFKYANSKFKYAILKLSLAAVIYSSMV